MNSKTLTLATARTLTLALAAFSIVMATPRVFAEDSADPSIKVHFSDLNLQSDAGVATLYGRIQSAARTVCNEAIPSSDPRYVNHYWKCVNSAVANAVNNVNSSTLTAMYQSKTGKSRVG